jgi:hypothetical protein
MKKILMIALLGLLAVNMNCGGGGSSSTSAKTSLTINLGEVRDVASYADTRGSVVSTSSIPSPVASIRIIISGPDMATIEEIIPTAGLTAISVTIEVPNGPNRHIVVEALNATGGVLYRGETYVNLDGTPVSVPIIMVSADPLPPTFAGLSNIDSITQTSMVLSWSPAYDNVTPQDKIQYLIYMATTSGGQNFSTPSFTTSLGATSYTVTGLNPDTTYYYVVWAMDEVGNKDGNMVEREATTLAPPDTNPPTFGGLESATALSATAIKLEWSNATDDRTPSAEIVYLIYLATTSGGQNFATPTVTTSPGVTSYTLTGLTKDTTYYAVVRARDAAGNTDANTLERSATTSSPEAVSQHWPDGYYGQFTYVDPSMTASSVTVAGPGISGSLALTYSSSYGSWNSWTAPSSPLYFGSTHPAPPLEYTFTVNDSSGSWTATDTIDCFMTEFATNLAPSGTVVGSPTVFTWTKVSQTNIEYQVQVNDSFYNRIWDSPILIDASSVAYSGPALTLGGTYNYYVVADPQVDEEWECASLAKESFLIGFIDLRPINVSADASNIWCDVENTGTLNAVNVTVWIEYNDLCTCWNCAPVTVSIPAGGTQPVSIAHGCGSIPAEYRIMVDTNKTFQEPDETNNCVTSIGAEEWCDDSPPEDCPYIFM